MIRYLPFYRRFIGGTKLSHLNHSKMIIDFSVESNQYRERNIQEIKNIINTFNNQFIAIKISAFGFDGIEKVLDEFNRINKTNKFLIDAEDYLIQDKINDIANLCLEKYNTKDKKVFYKTIQFYRKDSQKILEEDIKNFMYSDKYALKMVRGAYLETDKKYNILFNKKIETDNNFNLALKRFMDEQYFNPHNNLMCATHNEQSIGMLRYALQDCSYPDNFCFAQLLGFKDNITQELSEKYHVYKYVPYGPFWETMPYLIRRFYENKEMLKHC